MTKIGRNDPCPCGSGKKYKRCCRARDTVDEKLRARIVRGYERMMQGLATEACDDWWEVWLAVQPRLRPEMKTTDEAQRIYPDADSHIHDWTQDLAQELGNAARHRRRYAHRGVKLCRSVLAQFPDESELFRQCFRADLGEFYLLDGQTADGERELTGLIEDYPDAAIGYVRFAHALSGPDATSDHVRRAADLLQRARDRPVADAQVYDLEHQLDGLRHKLDRLSPSDAHATERATGTLDS